MLSKWTKYQITPKLMNPLSHYQRNLHSINPFSTNKSVLLFAYKLKYLSDIFHAFNSMRAPLHIIFADAC